MSVNFEAEQSILGCILKSGDLIKETTLQDKHFYDPNHKKLFKALRIIESKNDPIDIVAVITTLGQTAITSIGGRKFLAELANSVATTSSFKTYEKYIFESWKLREANEIQKSEIRSLDDLSKVMIDFSELELENSDDDYDHKENLLNLYNKIDNQTPGLSGFDTGYKELNKMLDGFQKEDLIISAARPSVGKTAKALNHASKHCQNGGTVIMFSLEMGLDSLNKRMLSIIGNIDGHKMRNPKHFFNDQDWQNFNSALGQLSDMDLHIYDKSGQTIPYIRSKVSKLRRQKPDADILVIIDYLQLIYPARKYENKNVEVADYTKSLKGLAKDMKVPVYLLAQLSRGVESRQDKRPIMSDLRDSGGIEQDADVIELLYRDDYYDRESESSNTIEVIITKQRNGAVGTVSLGFIKEYNLFLDLEA